MLTAASVMMRGSGWPGTSMIKQWLSSAFGADSALPRNDRAHQLIRVEAAFHERFRSTGAHQFDSLGCGGMAVLRSDHLNASKVEADFIRGAADALDGTHQDRIDQAQPHRLEHSAHGGLCRTGARQPP